MSNEENNSAFERRARELLRDSVDDLDAATRSRLTQARHAALAGRMRPGARPAWLDLRVLAPGGAVAAVALVAVLLWGGPRHSLNDSGSALDDLAMLADSDGYELSQEPDLDFIEWAAAMGETDPVGT